MSLDVSPVSQAVRHVPVKSVMSMKMEMSNLKAKSSNVGRVAISAILLILKNAPDVLRNFIWMSMSVENVEETVMYA